MSAGRSRLDPSDGPRDESFGMVARIASALTAWTEKWMPDAFIFALLATLGPARRVLRLDANEALRDGG